MDERRKSTLICDRGVVKMQALSAELFQTNDRLQGSLANQSKQGQV
jgi:hypothetical protein